MLPIKRKIWPIFQNMQKKWKTFFRKIDTKTDDFDTVLKTIKEFLEKPFISAAGNKEFTEKWSTADGKWM